MCSFIVTNKEINDLEQVNQYSKLRGPDYTNVIKKNGVTFVHNLLSITGKFTIQPFMSDNIVCVYNGEIYNSYMFGDYESDGECIIPLYKKYGTDFIKHLDGEFAIVLFDFEKNISVISSDIFATKPLWVARNETGFCISSYKSNATALGFTNSKSVPPNRTYVFDNTITKQLDTYEIKTFDLNQHKTTFDDWNIAFKNSINKRSSLNVREKSFIGLSSGYDSGAIASELIDQDIKYKAYTILGVENKEVMQKRFEYLIKYGCDHEILNSANRKEAYDYINKFVEDYYYVTYSSIGDYNEFNLRLQDDTGSTGLSMVCMAAKKDGRKIYLSGQGADEIFSDYGFQGRRIFHHSNFGGLFPKDLNTIFPWASFYDSTQRSYLTKEEHVAGSYGIEARYPFLDTAVVQEFLWLTPELKNNTYKSVLDQTMDTRGFPFAKGSKIGFGI